MVIKVSARRVDLDGMPLQNADLQNCTVSGSPLSAGGGGAWEFVTALALSGVNYIEHTPSSGYDYYYRCDYGHGVGGWTAFGVRPMNGISGVGNIYRRIVNYSDAGVTSSSATNASSLTDDTHNTYGGFECLVSDPLSSGNRRFNSTCYGNASNSFVQAFGTIISGTTVTHLRFQNYSSTNYDAGEILVWRRKRSA